MDSGLLRRALEYATDLERPLMLHEEDFGLTGGGCMHEGGSARAGLLGMPISGESGMIETLRSSRTWRAATYLPPEHRRGITFSTRDAALAAWTSPARSPRIICS